MSFGFRFSNKSETLPVENTKNITAVAISPDGQLLIAVSEGINIDNANKSFTMSCMRKKMIHTSSYLLYGSEMQNSIELFVVIWDVLLEEC